MMTFATLSLCVLASVPVASGIRKRRRGVHQASAVDNGTDTQLHALSGGRGKVDELVTLGAPGPFWSPPGNLGIDCFPGVRLIAYYGRREWYKPTTIDIVPSKTSLIGLKHFKMDIGKSDVNLRTYKVERCSAKSASDPVGVGTVALHMPAKYGECKSFLPARLSTMVTFARAAYRDDPVVVDEQLKPYGYRVVGTVTSQSDWKQVTHLLQNQFNLGCTLTFHGSESSNDWITNFKARFVDFCGLDTTVHLGFKQQLLRMVTNPDFQTRIRPNLPYCKTLTVAGHSMGGAVGELLAACLASAPENDPDYEVMGFMKETPKVLVPATAPQMQK